MSSVLRKANALLQKGYGANTGDQSFAITTSNKNMLVAFSSNIDNIKQKVASVVAKNSAAFIKKCWSSGGLLDLVIGHQDKTEKVAALSLSNELNLTGKSVDVPVEHSDEETPLNPASSSKKSYGSTNQSEKTSQPQEEDVANGSSKCLPWGNCTLI